MSVLNIITLQLLLPLMFICWLWGSPYPSRANWIVQIFVTSSVVGFVLIVGNQSWTSIYLGGFMLVLLLVASIRSFEFLPKTWLPFRFGDNWIMRLFISAQLIVGLIFISLTVFALSGYSADKTNVELQFPLDNGIYYVAHGGSNPLINYHNVNESQRYALDITKLNALGIRANGIYPKQLDRYAIYTDTLYSPCKGRIREIVSDQPDLQPPESDKLNVAGNHIVLECNTALVYLAHMLEGSASVKVNEEVEAGQPVGMVGNSGNTSEPHLHIHAERNGAGVPMEFNGRFLVRNSLVWR